MVLLVWAWEVLLAWRGEAAVLMKLIGDFLMAMPLIGLLNIEKIRTREPNVSILNQPKNNRYVSYPFNVRY